MRDQLAREEISILCDLMALSARKCLCGHLNRRAFEEAPGLQGLNEPAKYK
jgi:hypothetical protein